MSRKPASPTPYFVAFFVVLACLALLGYYATRKLALVLEPAAAEVGAARGAH